MKRLVQFLTLVTLTTQCALADTNAPKLSSTATNSAAPAVETPLLKNLKPAAGKRLVYVIPIQGEINSPMTYIVRRGVKEAMADKANVIVLDMDTPGGRVDHIEMIMDLIDRFDGDTFTFINKTAYSGGAFLSAATKHIYMTPGSVIGAAAPIVLSPGGGAEKEPETVEKKYTSAVAARIRSAAQKNGHNADVFEAMVNKVKGFKIDGKEIIKEGEILTLTNVEAERKYGNPPKPLVSEGTVTNFDDLLDKIGYANAEVKRIEPTGAEQLAAWITTIAPVLMLLGILGIYIEIKLQTFGLIGVLAILCFIIYFFGNYVAGLSFGRLINPQLWRY